MSHLRLNRARPGNALNQPAPIEMLIPAEIRNMIHSRLAPIDQFKVNLCESLRRVFNPYEIYAFEVEREDFPMLVYMYQNADLFDRVFMTLYTEYKEYIKVDGNHYSKFFGYYEFNPFSDPMCYPDSLMSYYKYMFDIYKYNLTDYYGTISSSSIDARIVFIKFCLIKLKRDRLQQKNSTEWSIREVSSDFWYSYTERDNNQLNGVWYIYYTIYCCIVNLLMQRNNTDEETTALYKILAEYFINETFENMPRLMSNIVNATHCDCNIIKECREDYKGTSKLYGLEVLHIDYIYDLEILFGLHNSDIISLQELESCIVKLIEQRIVTDFSDIQKYIYCSYPKFTFLHQNKYIKELHNYQSQISIDVSIIDKLTQHIPQASLIQKSIPEDDSE